MNELRMFFSAVQSLARKLWGSATFLLCMGSLFWALNPIVARAVRDEISPLSLAFWRWTVALSVVAIIARPRLAGDLRQIIQSWKILAFLGLVGVGLFSFVVYWALQYTTATNSLLLQSTMPIFTAILPCIIFRDVLSMRYIFAAIISLTGIGWIMVQGDTANFEMSNLNRGDLAALSAVFLYSVYATMLRKRPPLHHLTLLTVLFAVGAAALSIPHVIGIVQYGWEFVSGRAVAAILYVGIFPSLLSYAFFNRSVSLIGSTRAGAYMNLPSIFGVILAILLLGEAFHLYHFVGALLVALGITLAEYRRWGSHGGEA